MRKNQLAEYFNEDWDNTPDLEIVDLDTLDTANELEEVPRDNKNPSWSVPVLQWQRAFNRRLWHAVFVVGSLLLVCLLLLLNFQGIAFLTKKARAGIAPRFVQVPPKLTEHLPTPISINPSLFLPIQQLGFSCVDGEAWSSDSTMIAIQGYSVGCENTSSPTVSLISILDARSGRQLASFTPDTTIKKSFTLQYPATHGMLSIFYDNPSWSPDKSHFALTFSVSVQAVNSNATFTGVLIYDLQLKTFRVLIKQDAVKYSNEGAVSSYVEWDLVHGNSMSSPVHISDAPFFFSIPTAEQYTWGKNGELIPQTHETVPTASVGNTSGDPSFSIWQAGDLSLLTEDDLGFNYAPGIFLWNVHFVAWSPDGRYIIQSAYTAARLKLPGYPMPSQNVLAEFHLENVPVLPIRDQGMLSAAKALEDGRTQSIAAGLVSIAWSPNGKLMWRSPSHTSLTMLYTARYGFPTITLRQPVMSTSDAQRSHEEYSMDNSVYWSPDNQRILLQDSTTNAIIIYTLPFSLN